MKDNNIKTTVPTADDIGHKYLAFLAPRLGYELQPNGKSAMIEFARLHVQAVLDAVELRTKVWNNGFNNPITVIDDDWKDYVYPLDNIK